MTINRKSGAPLKSKLERLRCGAKTRAGGHPDLRIIPSPRRSMMRRGCRRPAPGNNMRLLRFTGSNTRRFAAAFALAALTGAGGVGLALTPLGMDFEKNVALPWLFAARGALPGPHEIAVAAIDRHTGGNLGMPALTREWPRSVHGRLGSALAARGASAIAFDMDFHRPRSDEEDTTFAKNVADADRVVLFQRLTGRRQLLTDAQGRRTGGSVWVEEILSPVAPLAHAAKALAPWALPKQQVAVYQFWTFKPSVGGAPTLPSVALHLHARKGLGRWWEIFTRLIGEAAADRSGRAPEIRREMAALRNSFLADPGLAKRVLREVDAAGGSGMTARQKRLAKAVIGLYSGPDHRFIDFYGPPGSIATIPYHAVIKGSDPNVTEEALDLRDKVVFVGFSDLDDPGQPDRFFTAFTREDGVDLSGVEIAAQALGNLLAARTLRPSETGLTAAVVAAFGLAVALLAYLLPAIVAVPAVLALGLAYAYGVLHQFESAGLWLPAANPIMVQLPFALLLGLLGQYLIERRQQRRVRATLSRYVDPALTDRLIAGGIDILGGRETNATILFSDIRGFTALTEASGAQETVRLLNEYFTIMVPCITDEGGMLDKFMGDAIMAAFGVPVERDDDEDRAARAGIAMLTRLRRWNAERAAAGLAPINIGIGLNTARIVSGNIGSPKRMDFTVIGDGVNLAARLETACKQYGAEFLLSETTFDKLKGQYRMREIDRVVVLGKSEPVRVYEVLEHHSEETFPHYEDVITRTAEGRDHFTAGRWDEAAAAFEAALKLHPGDKLSGLYIQRCAEMKANPPEHWEGVWRLDEK